MKKKILAISLTVLLLAAAAAGTRAVIHTRATAANIVTTANVNITLVQTLRGAALDNDGGDVIQVSPGETAELTVAVRNDGQGAAYIRVRAATALTDGETGARLPDTVTDAKGDTVPAVELAVNAADWVYSDGWYYYRQSVPAGGATAPVITGVTFSPAIGAGYERAQMSLDIETGAVQSVNNEFNAGAGQTVLDVTGWPA